ncbi:cytoplasmic dynein 1 light intermediate chain 1-like [Anopheles bellator]|uniref:cytoplasmic dynein 1 light intermediate chain 1-like n=1 Tax=Anopheles bellator TaxID=139047 RepID=UPI0026492718|nr:cytoplasmic dynein 1 light intermediate chain 1-like [Anopheles bellator]
MEILTQSYVHGLMTATSATRKRDIEAKENLWSSILGEVQTVHGNTKLPSNKSVLVLGDNESGKTTLVAKLQGVEDPKKGSGLEYAFIDVRDEYRDDATRLGMWTLDGDPGHRNLLKYALNELSYAHTLVIVTLSMKTPWNWLDQLQYWMKVLEDHIAGLPLEPDVKQQCQARVLTNWQNYCETFDDLFVPASPIGKRINGLSSVDDDVLTLQEDVLTTNLGLDVVVVVTKTDYMATLEMELEYRDEHFDFMQQWLRRLCLAYGASLFYTSAKEDKNCDLLYRYLTHRIYGLPFQTPAFVVEKDAIFVPAGWDNRPKISILYENLLSCKADDDYDTIIASPPSSRNESNRETEISTEDEQAFLARQQQLLHQGKPRGESPLRSCSPKKVDGRPTPGTQSGEGVLANFFNSLLHKKSISPGPTSVVASPRTTSDEVPTSDEISIRTEAALELDRLARSVNKDFDPSTVQSDC